MINLDKSGFNISMATRYHYSRNNHFGFRVIFLEYKAEGRRKKAESRKRRRQKTEDINEKGRGFIFTP